MYYSLFIWLSRTGKRNIGTCVMMLARSSTVWSYCPDHLNQLHVESLGPTDYQARNSEVILTYC